MNIYHISEELKTDPNYYISDNKIDYNDLTIGDYYALKIFHGVSFDAFVIKVIDVSDTNIVVEKLTEYKFDTITLDRKNKLFYNDEVVTIRYFRSNEKEEVIDEDSDYLFWLNEASKFNQRYISNKIKIPFTSDKQLSGIKNIFSGMIYEIFDNRILIHFDYSIRFEEVVKQLSKIKIKYQYDFEK